MPLSKEHATPRVTDFREHIIISPIAKSKVKTLIPTVNDCMVSEQTIVNMFNGT